MICSEQCTLHDFFDPINKMDSEFCEIDFTTATLWENFTSKIEEIFYSWKLYQPEETSSCENADRFSCEFGTWSVKKEKIDFGGQYYFY